MDMEITTAPPEDRPQVVPESAARGAHAPAPRDLIAEIILHSEPVVQILGMPPRWLVRWGATAMLAVVAFLVALAWLIHYPDVVPASVVITTPVPPVIVMAQASGHLTHLAVHEGDRVERGAVLALIQNTADPAAVTQLESVLTQLEQDKGPSNAVVADLATLALGELQGDYAAMARAHAAYAYNLLADPIGVQIRALSGQRTPLRERIESLQRQRELLIQEIAVAQRGLARTSELARRQDASQLTLDDRERTVLQARRALEGATAEVANARLELDRIEQSLTELGVRDRQQRQDLRVALQEAVKTLRGRLAGWERSYVLRAPIAGRVSLSRYWTNSQFIRTGDEVMALVPTGDQAPIGRLALPISRSGSVRIGQATFIRLDNYPSEQFGLLKGAVATISPVPQGGRYSVEVALPADLITTFGRQLDYQQEMQGQAEVVVEDLRVIDRIFYQFRRLSRRELVALPPPAGAR